MLPLLTAFCFEIIALMDVSVCMYKLYTMENVANNDITPVSHCFQLYTSANGPIFIGYSAQDLASIKLFKPYIFLCLHVLYLSKVRYVRYKFPGNWSNKLYTLITPVP